MKRVLRRSAVAGAVAAEIAAGTIVPAHAGPLPVSSVEQVAGERLAKPVYWYGWGPGWGAALATGAIVGGALGLAAAATAPVNPYWYGYPGYYPYPVYYGYRRVYWRPYRWRGYYAYPAYYRYRRAYWRPYRWGYPRVHVRRAVWY